MSGRLTFLDNPIGFRQGDPTQMMAKSKRETYAPRKYENVVLLIFGLSILSIAYYIGKYLFLCFVYGVSRVYSEGLHFTNMSKGHSWIVSNGDHIGHDLQPLLFVICAVIWIIPTFAGAVLIRRLLPKRNMFAGPDGANATKPKDLLNRPMERCSLVEKGHPFRTRSLLFLLYWVLVMGVFFIFAYWIGRLVLIFYPRCYSIILYFIYHRSKCTPFRLDDDYDSVPQVWASPITL